MEQKVTAFIKRNHLLTKGSTVLAGISGGPDSMSLLHYLVAIRKEWDLDVIALSVDHQLRGDESKQDLLYVKNMCEKWDVPFVGASLDVLAYKRKNDVSTQVASRDMRYHFFREQMQKFTADFLALGHHGDDQVETMLMHLVRTASSSAFSGIPDKRPFSVGYIVRPFLCVTKREIEAYCRIHHIVPRRDPSNEKTDYTRNYYRKHILPHLKEKNVNIHTTVQYLAETLNEDEKFLRTEAKKMSDQIVHFDSERKVASFKISEFSSYPSALQRRAFHLILKYLYHQLPKNLSYVHEENFFMLMGTNDGNIEIDLPHHLKIARSYQNVTFYFQHKQPQQTSFFHTIDVPGKINLFDGSLIFANYLDDFVEQDHYTYTCAVNRLHLPLHVRTRQPGDRMSWRGLNGTKKLKDIFIDAKIPLHKRDTWPIVTDHHGRILWVIGLKKYYPENKENRAPYIQLKFKASKSWEGQ